MSSTMPVRARDMARGCGTSSRRVGNPRPNRRRDEMRLRSDAREWILIYLVSVATRLTVWRSPLFGDEAWHFYAARHWGAAATNVHMMWREDVAPLAHLFWWRPLF